MTERLSVTQGSREKEMETNYSIPAWRIPQTKEPGGLQPTGHKESDTAEATEHSTAQGLIASTRENFSLLLIFFPDIVSILALYKLTTQIR